MTLHFPFPKEIRLRSRFDYRRMNRSCTVYTGEALRIETRKNRRGLTRLGITVTKKYGKAHERNRFKRSVREAFRLSYQELLPGLDVNVRPKHKGSVTGMRQVQKELLQFLKAT